MVLRTHSRYLGRWGQSGFQAYQQVPLQSASSLEKSRNNSITTRCQSARFSVQSRLYIAQRQISNDQEITGTRNPETDYVWVGDITPTMWHRRCKMVAKYLTFSCHNFKHPFTTRKETWTTRITGQLAYIQMCQAKPIRPLSPISL